MGTKRFSNPQALSSALAALGTLQPRAFGLLNHLVPLVLASNYYVGSLTYLFTPCMECCGDVSCLRIPIDREESNARKDKRITMAL